MVLIPPAVWWVPCMLPTPTVDLCILTLCCVVPACAWLSRLEMLALCVCSIKGPLSPAGACQVWAAAAGDRHPRLRRAAHPRTIHLAGLAACGLA